MTLEKKKIALVTCAEHPQLFADEQLLLGAIAERGEAAVAAVWSDPSIDWKRFDRVVLRSTWDYFERIEEFGAWLDRLDHLGVTLVNPTALVRWNLDKRYLRQLEREGIAIVPTRFVEPGERFDLAACVREGDWTQAVVKPAISGAAYRTHRFAAAEAPSLQGEVDAILQGCGVLVQPFMNQIVDEGEWSMLFFAGEFSHAVLKTASAGDFRVQSQFGGAFRRVTPPPSLLAAATRIVRTLPAAPLYARIDGIRRGDEFLLMEVEVIEPYLYFPAAPEAVARYVQALLAA